MRPPIERTVRVSLLAVAAGSLALAAAGCGADDESTDDAGTPAPSASSFPAAEGQPLENLAADAAPGDDLVVSPAGQVFTEGRNRFGFGVFSVDGEQITDAEVAIYAAPGPDGEAEGPFPAKVESLATEPAFTAENTAADPDAAKAVYVTEIPFDSPGEWRLMAMVNRDDGEPTAVRMPSVSVQSEDPVPGAGDEAPEVHTPTADEVTSIEQIDTRIPPGTMHEDDLADVLGKKPVILLFATPALCQSRVCGPVVDIAEQVKRDRPDDAAYIHMEIFENNQPPKVRPQVAAYKLPTEPWLFAIDCDGRIDSRLEGAFSIAELNQALDRIADSC